MRKLFISILMTIMSFSVFAQGIDDVTLVVNGMAATKEEATNIALRSAIEQAFGVFVSANTSIVNDELVKDEIATVASGNVKSYKEIESVILPNNMCAITLEAVVSTQKLVAYAKSKGSSCEFAGATLMANRKLLLLNKTNTEKVFENLLLQLEEIAPFIFDYKLLLNEPALNSDKRNFLFPIALEISSNENTEGFVDLLCSTLTAVSLDEDEKRNAESLLGEKMFALELRSNKLYFHVPFDLIRYEQIIDAAMNNVFVESNLGNQYHLPVGFWANSEIGVKYIWREDGNYEDKTIVKVPDFNKSQPLVIATSNLGIISVPINDVDMLTGFTVVPKQEFTIPLNVVDNLIEAGFLDEMVEIAKSRTAKSDSRFVNYKNHPYIVAICEEGLSVAYAMSEIKPVDLLTQVIEIDVDKDINYPALRVGDIVGKLLATREEMDIKEAKFLAENNRGELNRRGYEYINRQGFEYVAKSSGRRYDIIQSLLSKIRPKVAYKYKGYNLSLYDVNEIIYWDYRNAVSNISFDPYLEDIQQNPEKDPALRYRAMKQEWIIF